MLEDKQRWNKRYLESQMPQTVSPLLEKYISHVRTGNAIDIACGTGRNTHFLANKGFVVDAVDLSDYALDRVRDDEGINKIESDLDSYNLKTNSYELVVNFNYLNRRLLAQITNALKLGGVVIFETFIVAHGDFLNPKNKDYLLNTNELLNAFRELEIIYYEEHYDINLKGEEIKVASLVAKKS